MKELIAVRQQAMGQQEVNTVNARYLHAFLESKQEFSNLKECLVNAVKDCADLSVANLSEDIEISLPPIQLDSLTYYVTIFDNHMKIGCELHAISEWLAFNDKQIATMDGDKATQFWEKWKAPLQAICAAESRA